MFTVKPPFSLASTLAPLARWHPRLQGCVGWWPMVEAGGTILYDMCGRSQHGTLTNYPVATAWGPGQFGPALVTGGNDEQIQIGATPLLDGTPTLTYTGWARQTPLDVRAGLFYRGPDAQQAIFFETWTDGQLYLEISAGSSAYGFFDYSTVVTENVWFHFAVVFDGAGSTNTDKLRLYINGVLQTLLFFGTLPATTANLSGAATRLGIYQGAGTDDEWNGQLDELRLYVRALSSTEVQSLYRQPLLEWDWALAHTRRRVWAVPLTATLVQTAFRWRNDDGTL